MQEGMQAGPDLGLANVVTPRTRVSGGKGWQRALSVLVLMLMIVSSLSVATASLGATSTAVHSTRSTTMERATQPGLSKGGDIVSSPSATRGGTHVSASPVTPNAGAEAPTATSSRGSLPTTKATSRPMAPETASQGAAIPVPAASLASANLTPSQTGILNPLSGSANLSTSSSAPQPLTMTPLVCSMTISASPLGDFVGQQVTFTASGCTPPSGYYWTWGNLPPGCTTQNSGTLSCTPRGDGLFDTFASIISSGGSEYANAHTEITVYSDLAVTYPTTPVDTGMWYNLSVSPTSDSVGDLGYFYYYQWSNLPPGCTDNSGQGGGVSTGHPWSGCTTGTSGTYTPSLSVIYSNGEQVSSSLTLTVSSPPTASLSGPASKDVGQSITFTASVSGGSTPFEYEWVAGAGKSLDQYFGNCPSAVSGPSGQSPPWTTLSSVTCTATTATNVYVLVVVQDAAGKISSAGYTIVLYADPTISTIQPSRGTLDLNQAVWFNASVTGGSGGDHFSWTGLPSSGCSGTTSWSVKCTVSQTGSVAPSATVTDSNSITSPSVSSSTVTAFSDPQVTGITISRPSADVNQQVWFNATESGGYSGGKGYSYTWSGLPSGCPATSSWTVACKVTATGKFTPVVSVTDGDGYASPSFTSSASLTIYGDPTISTPTASPKAIDVTQTTTFSVTVTAPAGGPYVVWTGLPQGCTSSDTTSLTCTPPSWTGTAQVVATVTDGNGYTVSSSTLSFTVSPLPVANTPTPMRNMSGTYKAVTSSDLGQKVTFIVWYFCLPGANCGEGSGGDQYSWAESGAGLGCVSSTQEYVNCTSTTAGTYTVTFTITDSNGGSSSATPPVFTVYPDPSVPIPSPSMPTVDIGTTLTFTASPSGGSGIYTYAWSGLPSGTGCATANVSAIACTPSVAGQANVSVTVTDTNGFTAASKGLPFTVHSSPIASLQVNRSKLDANEQILFYANASGGTGTYNYAYSGLPAGCTSSNTSRLVCTPGVNGPFVVTVWVNDTGGGKANSSVPFIVYPDPKITSHWFWEGGQTAYANETLSVMVNFTGGITPYTLCFYSPPAWLNPCVPGQGGTNFSFMYYHYGKEGSYLATANLTDSTGWESTIQFTETIYYPILVTPPSVTTVHEGSRANASFSIYNEHGAPPIVWWLNDSTNGSPLCGPLSTGTYGAQQCSFTPTWNGTNDLNLTLEDALHGKLSVTFNYTVVPDVGALTISGSVGSYSAIQGNTLQDEVGATTTFQASYSGGTGPYTCTLTENGSGPIITWASATSSCSNTYSWAHGGTYTVNFTVQDSMGGNGGSAVQWMIVHVAGPVIVSSITPLLSTLDAQVNDNISTRFGGGLTPYSFSWNLGNGVTKTTTQPWLNYAWPSSGTFTVTMTVTDGAGMTSTQSTQVRVDADPAVKVMSVSDGPISATGITSGGTITLPAGTASFLNLTFTGGIGPYSVTWKVNGTTVNTSGGALQWVNVSLAWPSAGTFAVTVAVTDSEGQVSTFTLTPKVVLDTVGPITLAVAQSVVDLGMWSNVSATASGGWAPFAYDWEIASASGNKWINGSVDQLDVAWDKAGSYTVTATVVDAFGHKASEATSLTVNSAMTVPCAPTLVSGVPMAGNPLSLTLTCLSGGSAPYSYVWSLGSTHSTTTVPRLSFTPQQASTYSISVNVTDSLGVTVHSGTLTVGTVPPAISNVTTTVVSSTVNGSILHVSLDTAIQSSDTDGQVLFFRWATSLSNLSSAQWTNSTLHMVSLNVSKSTSMVELYFQVEDSMGRTSTPYEVPLNTSALLPPAKSGPTGASEAGMSTGEIFLILIGVITLVMVAIVAFMSLRQRNRRSPGSEQVSTSAPPDVLTPVIAAQVKETPGQSLDLLAHTVATKTKTTVEFAKTEIAQLASTGLIEKRWEKGEEHYYPVEGSAESSEEESIRRDLETKTAVYSALEGKGWTPLETLHETTQAQTRLTRDQLAKWISDYNGEYRIEYRPAGDSLEVRLDNQARESPSQEVIVDPAVLSTIQLDDRAVHAPEFPEPKGPTKPGRSRRPR